MKKYFPDIKKTLILSYPIILGQVGQLTVGVVDNIMIGQVGKIEFSAASLANSIFFIFFPFSFGIISALSSLIPEANARGEKDKVQKLFSNGLIIGLFLGIFVYGLVKLLYPIVGYLDQPEEVTSIMGDYTNIIMLSYIPMTVFFVFRFTADSLSRTKPAMYSLIIGNIINVFFNYVLIYGKLGFPEMGLNGAALGTLISRISSLSILIYMFYKSNFFNHFLKDFKFKLYDKVIMRKIFSIGVPSSFQMFFEIGAFAMVSFIIGLFGADAIAGNQIANQMISISFLLMTGIMIATTIRTGDALGRNDFIAIRRIMKVNMFIVISFMGIMGLLFFIFRYQIPLIFNDDPTVVIVAAELLIIGAFFQLSDAIQMIALGALRGIQDVKIPTVITFIAYWVIALPLGYILGKYYNLNAMGIWIGLGLGLTFAGIFFILRFNKLIKIKLYKLN